MRSKTNVRFLNLEIKKNVPSCYVTTYLLYACECRIISLKWKRKLEETDRSTECSLFSIHNRSRPSTVGPVTELIFSFLCRIIIYSTDSSSSISSGIFPWMLDILPKTEILSQDLLYSCAQVNAENKTDENKEILKVGKETAANNQKATDEIFVRHEGQKHITLKGIHRRQKKQGEIITYLTSLSKRITEQGPKTDKWVKGEKLIRDPKIKILERYMSAPRSWHTEREQRLTF